MAAAAAAGGGGGHNAGEAEQDRPTMFRYGECQGGRRDGDSGRPPVCRGEDQPQEPGRDAAVAHGSCDSDGEAAEGRRRSAAEARGGRGGAVRAQPPEPLLNHQRQAEAGGGAAAAGAPLHLLPASQQRHDQGDERGRGVLARGRGRAGQDPREEVQGQQPDERGADEALTPARRHGAPRERHAQVRAGADRGLRPHRALDPPARAEDRAHRHARRAAAVGGGGGQAAHPLGPTGQRPFPASRGEGAPHLPPAEARRPEGRGGGAGREGARRVEGVAVAQGAGRGRAAPRPPRNPARV
mmetsp:Transcript_7880/g.19229  ORF Transcript_7880/g.19229 Transcript_7880/m.19229 type:complete len:298 (-) Transcript_7880:158-1051(-)